MLASGGRLLTDDVEGLKGLFPAEILPNGVATFTAPVELLATVESGPAKFYDDERLRANLAARANRAFIRRARARVMLEDVRRQRAATGV